jgi:hypothetical protein
MANHWDTAVLPTMEPTYDSIAGACREGRLENVMERKKHIFSIYQAVQGAAEALVASTGSQGTYESPADALLF